jgi:phosphatidylglycerophosphatase A
MNRRPVVWLAMLGGAGLSPIAPATVGSALVACIAWFVPTVPTAALVFLLTMLTGLAVGIANEAEKDLGHDAGPIVIDEAVGMSLALLLVPRTIPAYLAAFLLFRLFDIWKPLGAREAQSLPGGVGVVADDVIAGLTSAVAMQGLLWLQRAQGWNIL